MKRLSATYLWLALLAFGGLLAGHLASYFVVAPDAHARADLLASTGHSSHASFATAAMAATAAAVIGLVAQHLRARRVTGPAAMSRTKVAGLLATAQVCGFVWLEAWERGHALAGVAELLHEPAFLVGLVAQVLVAFAATAIVLLVRATVDALLRLLVRPAHATEPLVFVSTSPRRAKSSVARSARNLRGPPSPAGFPS